MRPLAVEGLARRAGGAEARRGRRGAGAAGLRARRRARRGDAWPPEGWRVAGRVDLLERPVDARRGDCGRSRCEAGGSTRALELARRPRHRYIRSDHKAGGARDGGGMDGGDAVAEGGERRRAGEPAVRASRSPMLLARGRFPGKAALDVVVHLPLVLPPVVTGWLLLIGFGRQGPLGDVFRARVRADLRLPLDRRGAGGGGDGFSADGAGDPAFDREPSIASWSRPRRRWAPAAGGSSRPSRCRSRCPA